MSVLIFCRRSPGCPGLRVGVFIQTPTLIGCWFLKTTDFSHLPLQVCRSRKFRRTCDQHRSGTMTGFFNLVKSSVLATAFLQQAGPVPRTALRRTTTCFCTAAFYINPSETLDAAPSRQSAKFVREPESMTKIFQECKSGVC